VSAIPISQVGRNVSQIGQDSLRNRLFIEYKANPTKELRNRIAELHIGIVKNIALKIHSKLPGSISLDDLIQDGSIAMLACIDRFDPSRGIKFATFAARRVHGAIQDSLRDWDWASRQDRQRGVSIPEIASISLKWSNGFSGEARSFEDILADENADPETPVDDIDQFEAMIRKVPAYFRPELRLRFIEGLSMKEIGQRLGRSESRISQKLSDALSMLREKILV
jgi:RNA polymerase sigma factor for flagellar operon FliA